MAARIRYEKHPTKDNCVISIQKFVSDTTGAKYKIILDYNDNTYAIRNERNKEFVVKSKSYGNLNVLKRNARSSLEKLGVQLNKESRDRCFGLCEKNYTQEQWEKENN